MNSEALLSICIPTYNRSELLKNNVRELIEEIRPFNLPILISDNNSTDGTAQAVELLKKEYKNIIYYKQSTNISDLNFPFILKQATTKYAWLLGDKNRIIPGATGKILQLMNEDSFDAIVVNCNPARVKSLPTKVYIQPEDLLYDLGWHATMISTLIFSKELIGKAPFERYSSTKFMHVAGLFDAISNTNCKVLWLNEPFIQGPDVSVKNDWLKDVFPVFFDSWANSIMSLSPAYPLNVKLHCIKQHGSKSKVFIFERFIYYRSKKIFNFKIFKNYYSCFPLFTNVPRTFLFFILCFPGWFYASMYYLLAEYRKLIGKENF
jgi:glycosyltransferase involved in cell wall biosynthesis